MTIGVHLPEDQARDWVSALAALLPHEIVADVADIADPADVEILIVGNPAATELVHLSSLRFIQSTWAGPDRLSSDPNRPAVPTSRLTGGGLATTMAEFVTATVMSAHRQFPTYRSQQTDRIWKPLDQPTAIDRTVGFLGYGHLAQASARMLVSLGFNVIAWARSARRAEVEVSSGSRGLSDLLHSSDVIVNLLPLTPQTTGLLDADFFEQCQPGIALVHCGRGPQVKVPDLVSVLDSGHLSHAWLDVFTVEPLGPDDPLWTNPAVTITPHIAASSSPALLASDVADNIKRFRNAQTPHGLI